MEKNTNTKVPSNEDEIDLRKLFDAIWDGKWIIVASTTILSIIAVLISISLPNVYKSEALLSPVVSEAGAGTEAGFAGDRYAYIKPGRTIALKLSYQR